MGKDRDYDRPIHFSKIVETFISRCACFISGIVSMALTGSYSALDTLMKVPARAICFGCANKRGATWPKGHKATSWLGECIVCGEKRSVNSTDDWDWVNGEKPEKK